MKTTPMTMNQELLEFAPDPDTAGFRLHELSVYNWGTFHGRTFSIKPDGRTAILSGGNGTGKSTLADALLTLLVPNRKRNYNQAGQTQKRSERNERDYVLGAYSEKHDEVIGTERKQFLRKEPGDYTVLIATFYNEVLNSWVSLAQVLWVNSSNKVEKVFITEPRRLSIEVEFNHLDTPATFRRILKDDRGLTIHDSFAAYSERFHDLLCMPKDKTPMEIFNQAICIKDITDLTSFIREFMLDDGGAAEKLASLRRNFTELRDTNRKIELASRQGDTLSIMHADHRLLMSLQDELEDLNLKKKTLSPYFAEEEIRLREAHSESIERRKVMLEADQIKAENEIEDLEEKIAVIQRELSGSKEGRRLEEIATIIKSKTKERDDKKNSRQRFDGALQKWNSGLKVHDSLTFIEVHRNCEQRKTSVEKRHSEIEETEIPQKQIEKRDLESMRHTLESEERSLLERTNNIPDRNLQVRSLLLEKLGLIPDDLPFVGELVQVKQSEGKWTGAIERLVHSFALCIVVSSKLRDQVDAFVHKHRQRGLIVYHAVPDQIKSPNPRLQNQSVANKLEIKSGTGEICDWLKSEISYRFDHICCLDTGDQFRNSTNALTLTGLIKNKGSERRKDDRRKLDDASNYVLGWDNREKLAAIVNERKLTQENLDKVVSKIETLKQERTDAKVRLNAAEYILDNHISFSEVDWESVAKEIDELEGEKRRLKSSSNRLNQLESEKSEANAKLKNTRELKENLIGQLAVLASEFEKNIVTLASCRQLVETCEQAAEHDDQFANFRTHYQAIKRSLAFPLTDLVNLKSVKEDAEQALGTKLSTRWADFNKRSQRIKMDMQKFSNDPENETFKDRLAADYTISGYNKELWAPFDSVRIQILEDDLPKNQHRFSSLLHSTITDDVTIWDELLETHAKRIVAKINELNQQLQQIDFDRQERTYIQLVPTRSEETAIREFRALRRNALQDSLNASTDKEALAERYHRIEYMLNQLEQDPEKTKRIIDVRNWFTFRADEFYRADDGYRQSYGGASGKSGGEKNRLASTILATAIAYQYGISIRNRQTETFRLVAVDEMFSKTDDEFSRYLLELFKEFHLQLLIIQPLDAKIHLVQKYVERYHIVTKRGENSSVRTLSVEEYKKIRATI